MRNERNTPYCSNPGMMPGMPGTGPMPGMMPGMPGAGPMPGMMPGMSQGTDQVEQRLSRLESQVRRLDIRLSRLETPYPEQNLYSTENQYGGSGIAGNNPPFPNTTQTIQGL
jgi:hypothetical protein